VRPLLTSGNEQVHRSATSPSTLVPPESATSRPESPVSSPARPAASRPSQAPSAVTPDPPAEALSPPYRAQWSPPLAGSSPAPLFLAPLFQKKEGRVRVDVLQPADHPLQVLQLRFHYGSCSGSSHRRSQHLRSGSVHDYGSGD